MMPATRRARGRRTTITARADLVTWAADEAERRVCSRTLIVDAALELLREAIELAPDLIKLPEPPRAR